MILSHDLSMTEEEFLLYSSVHGGQRYEWDYDAVPAAPCSRIIMKLYSHTTITGIILLPVERK